MARTSALVVLMVMLVGCVPEQAEPPFVPTATMTPFQPISPTVTPISLPTPTPIAYTFLPATFEDVIPQPPPVRYQAEGWVLAFLGTDELPHRKEQPYTDTIILLLINPPHLSLLSLPRDLYVFLPGFGMTRINRVWSLRGEDGLRDMLRYNFGLPLDGYAVARPHTLENFIDDVLGDIQVAVVEPVHDRCGDVMISYQPGIYDMDGRTAVCFARVRLNSSDYPRMLRGQSVLLGMRDRALELAGNEPLAFFRNSLAVAKSMGLQASVDIASVVEFLWVHFVLGPESYDVRLVEQVPEQYRMMPPWSEHFDHPVSGAWLLRPPEPECMEDLIAETWFAEPWECLPFP